MRREGPALQREKLLGVTAGLGSSQNASRWPISEMSTKTCALLIIPLGKGKMLGTLGITWGLAQALRRGAIKSP